jgi:hypothetical protein
MGGQRQGSSGSGQGQLAGSCEDGNEAVGPKKCGEFPLFERTLGSQEGLCSVELVYYRLHACFQDFCLKGVPFHSAKLPLHHHRRHCYIVIKHVNNDISSNISTVVIKKL